jgi:putative hydrolase of the HAD superfamily
MPFPDVVALLEALQGRLPLAIITNGFGDTQREKLEVMRIHAHFELVLAAGDLGIGKPDPAIFQYALDKLALAADAVWHVGDSLTSDVAGAKASGLTAVWLNRQRIERRSGDAEPDLEIVSLAELLPLLDDASR